MRISHRLRAAIPCLLAASALAQPSPCTWSRDKPGAVSLTFDDGIEDQFTLARPMLDAKGIQATFFVMNAQDGYASALNAGHEIGAHTPNHQMCEENCTSSIFRTELAAARTAATVSGYPGQCQSFAYPGGGSGDPLAIAEMPGYFVAARGAYIEGGHTPEDSTPAGMWSLSTWDGSLCTLSTAARSDYQRLMHTSIDATVKKRGWSIFLFHDINQGTDQCNSVSLSTLTMDCDSLLAHKSDLWIAPFGTVARYIWERRYATVTPDSSGPGRLRYSVGWSPALDAIFNLPTLKPDSVFTVPLTLKMPLPAGWDNATVSQGGRATWSQVVATGGAKILLFEAVPKRGTMEILAAGPAVTSRPAKSRGAGPARGGRNALGRAHPAPDRGARKS